MAIQVLRKHNLTGHNDCIYALEQADSPNLFFSGSADGMVVLWDLKNPEHGELIAKVPNSVYAVHHHKPSGCIVVGHNYNGIHVIDWKNKVERAALGITKEAIFDIQSIGSRLFVGDKSGMLTEINLEKISIVKQFQVSEKSIRTLAVNPADNEIAVGSSDHFIRVFDLDSWEVKYQYQAHTNSVFTLAYTQDYQYLVSGSRDARIKLWDVRVGYMLVTEVVAHMHTINHIHFSPDSKHFVTCSMDRSIKVWNLDEMKLLKVIDKGRHAGHGTSVNKLLWTNYEGLLVSASDDRTLSVWSIDL